MVPIWTTTPWTIPANRAIAYGDNINYLLLKIEECNCEEGSFNNKNILIAEERLNNFIEVLKINKYKLIDKILGKNNKRNFLLSSFT